LGPKLKVNLVGSIPKRTVFEPFPEDIITLPILQTTKHLELVLDAFMGSRTTGRVCDKLGRGFVGYDLKGY
jgi:DNA modification methylase